MAQVRNYRIELKAGIFNPYGMDTYYEVWFTDAGQEKWRVSKPVCFERVIELLKIMHEAYTAYDASAILLPEEFHIVGRLEPKQLTSGELQ